MTSYIAITDAETDPEAPLTATLAKKWRDNPIAIAEGDATAPAISGALTAVVSGNKIGTFIFARGPSTTAYGATVAGSSLTYAGALSSATSSSVPSGGSGSGLTGNTFNAGASGVPSGTFRCLGHIQASASATGFGSQSASATAATLWQRIA